MRIPGVSALTVKADYLHCMYLGALQYFLGSVLVLLIFDIMQEGSEELNLRALIVRLRGFWNANAGMPRLTPLRLKSFLRPGKFPQLKGRAVVQIICTLVGEARRSREGGWSDQLLC